MKHPRPEAPANGCFVYKFHESPLLAVGASKWTGGGTCAHATSASVSLFAIERPVIDVPKTEATKHTPDAGPVKSTA